MEGCDPTSSARRVLLVGATNRPEVGALRWCCRQQGCLAVHQKGTTSPTDRIFTAPEVETVHAMPLWSAARSQTHQHKGYAARIVGRTCAGPAHSKLRRLACVARACQHAHTLHCALCCCFLHHPMSCISLSCYVLYHTVLYMTVTVLIDKVYCTTLYCTLFRSWMRQPGAACPSSCTSHCHAQWPGAT
jgi:hypothetical protein